MSNKVFYVSTRREYDANSYLLVDAEAADLMGIPCIRGTFQSASTKPHWMDGRVSYIPIANVSSVVEYESLDAYRDSMRRYHEAQL